MKQIIKLQFKLNNDEKNFYTFEDLKWDKNGLKKNMYIVFPGVFLWTFSGATSASV